MKRRTGISFLAVSSFLSAGVLFPVRLAHAAKAVDDATVRAELEDLAKTVDWPAIGGSGGAGGGLEGLDRLIRMGPPAEREALRWVEGKKGPPEMRDALVDEVLPSIADQKALPTLNRMLRDAAQPETVRVGSARCIGAVGGKDALRMLSAVADDPAAGRAMRVAAIGALGDMADKASAATLAKKLADGDPAVQVAAARALHATAAKTGDKSISDPLVAMVQDRKSPNRNIIIELLGQSEHREAVPVLAKILQDEKEGVRLEAADALGQLGGGEALTALIDVLEDNDELLRAHAAKAAVKAGLRPEHLPLLKRAIELSRDEHVRQEIQSAVDQVRGR
jgi:HEAT repeat protein